MACHFFDRFRRKMPLLLDFYPSVCYNYRVKPRLMGKNKKTERTMS